MTDPTARREGPEPADPVEALVANCLERADGEGDAAVESVCRAHPEHAAKIRERLERLRRMGFSTAGGGERGRDFPDRLGDFRLLERLGGGGMGVVYLARQEPLGRDVALKLIRPDQVFFPGARERFRREVEAVARLQHPGIVPIYTVGEAGGLPFFAMEHVEGCTLQEALEALESAPVSERRGADLSDAVRRRTSFRDRDGLPPAYMFEGSWVETCCRVARHLADALEHAHRRGVHHRDVKPSNVMLTPAGRVMLLDFGLASAEGAGRLTRTGSQLGSLPYMSPEQLSGDVENVDRRTDVYSLGVTLYEMLSGALPFDAGTTTATTQAIVAGNPPAIRALNPSVSWDAETVCRKAMDRDPLRRYAAMADFGRDLENVLQRRPIEARRPGVVLRIRRWVQRNPVASTVLAFLLVSLATSFYFIGRISEQRDEVLRLSDVRRLSDLRSEADRLWPAIPENASRMEAWLVEARRLADRLALHRATLASLGDSFLPYDDEARREDRETHPRAAELRDKKAHLERDLTALAKSESIPTESRLEKPEEMRKHVEELPAEIADLEIAVGERRTFRFADPERQWQHDTLSDLVRGIEDLTLPGEVYGPAISSVERRLEFARTVERRSIDEAKDRWDEAIASIANPDECPIYGGLEIPPQLGLVPIGRDLDSGLWEFVHLQTGEAPERGEDGRLRLDEKMGLVLVLIPGGSFRMGLSGKEAKTSRSELPAHDVALDAYFISKFEMTQGQWLRFTGKNPSFYGRGSLSAAGSASLLRPVEYVSWDDASRVLRQLGLDLPTEAQWERAARGGTVTKWWCGDDPAALASAGNLADAHAKANGGPANWHYETWSDGQTLYSAVGGYRANPFGLHDVYGNLFEWCRDGYAKYTVPVRPGDGERSAAETDGRVHRGGSYGTAAMDARSASRSYAPGHARASTLGVRPAREVNRD